MKAVLSLTLISSLTLPLRASGLTPADKDHIKSLELQIQYIDNEKAKAMLQKQIEQLKAGKEWYSYFKDESARMKTPGFRKVDQWI